MSKKKLYWDIAERVVWTFVQAAAAVLLVEQSWNLDLLKIALTAGALSVLKGIAATQIGGDSSSAATLPVAQQE